MTTWVYFLENTSTTLWIDNSPLFKLIQELGIGEEAIFIEDVAATEPVELKALMNVVQKGDTVLVRSLADLAGADGGPGVLHILQVLEEQGVDVASVLEPWYGYGRYYEAVERTVKITEELAERKRRVGMERAKRAGRMGRHPAQDSQGQMERLRQAGFSVKETCDLCGVSRSTYYRRTGRQRKNRA